MSLFKKFYEMCVGKASLAIDEATDPEDKVRIALNDLEETAPAIREAVAGPIAEANRLETKRSEAAARVKYLEGQIAAAVAANNTEVATIRGGSLLDKRRELADIETRLTAANAKAADAREKYADWKKKTTELQSKAMQSLDTNRQAEAQEQFNAAMHKIDATAIDSTINEAMTSIDDRAARADAASTLDENPDEKALRDFEKSSRQSDVADLLKEFAPAAETATTNS